MIHIETNIRPTSPFTRPTSTRRSNWIQCWDIQLSFIDFGTDKSNHPKQLKRGCNQFQCPTTVTTMVVVVVVVVVFGIHNGMNGSNAQGCHNQKFDHTNQPWDNMSIDKTLIQNEILLYHHWNNMKTTRQSIHSRMVQPSIPPIPFCGTAIRFGQGLAGGARTMMLMMTQHIRYRCYQKWYHYTRMNVKALQQELHIPILDGQIPDGHDGNHQQRESSGGIEPIGETNHHRRRRRHRCGVSIRSAHDSFFNLCNTRQQQQRDKTRREGRHEESIESRP